MPRLRKKIICSVSSAGPSAHLIRMIRLNKVLFYRQRPCAEIASIHEGAI
uniref:Uncharacterized protein n=1 Tax=Anguilla anguilla TaxID=7936 RepID=A0A0E9SVS2_ANGAN